MSTREYAPRKSVYEIASQNLRDTLRYLHRELKLPREALELQVRGILHSFEVEDAHARNTNGEGK